MQYKGLNSILLIDDDEATNFLNKMTIEDSMVEAHIEVITEAQKGLDYLLAKGEYQDQQLPQPGIIFLDINMPGMDGWQFLARYDKLPENRKADVVVAMLTTSEHPADIEKAKARNEIHQLINKALTQEDLMRIIERNFHPINDESTH